MSTSEGLVYGLKVDAWLSEVCGWPCFRVSEELDLANARQIQHALIGAAEDRAFFYAKRPTSDVAARARLTSAGFAVIDCDVTLQWDPRHASPAFSAEISVGLAEDRQHQVIQNIAESCFRFSRFHADPLFPTLIANAIKREWIKNYCVGKRGDVLFAAEVGGRAVGFLAALVTGEGSSSSAVIDLVGVTPDFQGQGVGRALVGQFIKYWRNRATRLIVGTQAANIASLRFYESCGFHIIDTNWMLHAHTHGGALIKC